jgi:NAD(P)-dependent dehydrogenase (short-subunit alcohol dehydrogenase family)
MMVDDDGSPEAKFFSNLTALGRMGRVEDVVGIYNFLASESSTFISGQELRVDGGMTAGLGQPLLEAMSQ